MPGRTSADKESHVGFRLSTREPCWSPRTPKAALRPGPNRGRRKIVRERADQAAVPGVAPATPTGLSASCLLTQHACRARGWPVDARAATPTMTRRAELARAPTSPPRHHVRLARSPPSARCPLRVRTPALVPRALLRPARRWVPRRTADARTFYERSAGRALSRPRESTCIPNGTPGKGNIARW